MSAGTVFSSTLISGGWDQTKTELKVMNTSKIVILCFFLNNNGLCIFMQAWRVRIQLLIQLLKWNYKKVEIKKERHANWVWVTGIAVYSQLERLFFFFPCIFLSLHGDTFHTFITHFLLYLTFSFLTPFPFVIFQNTHLGTDLLYPLCPMLESTLSPVESARGQL